MWRFGNYGKLREVNKIAKGQQAGENCIRLSVGGKGRKGRDRAIRSTPSKGADQGNALTMHWILGTSLQTSMRRKRSGQYDRQSSLEQLIPAQVEDHSKGRGCMAKLDSRKTLVPPKEGSGLSFREFRSTSPADSID